MASMCSGKFEWVACEGRTPCHVLTPSKFSILTLFVTAEAERTFPITLNKQRLQFPKTGLANMLDLILTHSTLSNFLIFFKKYFPESFRYRQHYHGPMSIEGTVSRDRYTDNYWGPR
jgi:hypothetical protein